MLRSRKESARKDAGIIMLPSRNAGDVDVTGSPQGSAKFAMVVFALVFYVAGFVSGTFFVSSSRQGRTGAASAVVVHSEPSAVTEQENSYSDDNDAPPANPASHVGTTSETPGVEQKWVVPKRPDDWETWSFHHITDHFACRDYVNNPINPNLPSLEYWQFLRKTYVDVVDSSYKFDSLPPTKGYSADSSGSPPFYYAKASPGKGRGLFASRDIKKGEAFEDGSSPDAQGTIFPNGMAFRRFLFSLPSEMVCDATRWAWTQQFEEHGPYFMVMSFNIDSLMNTGKHPNAMAKSSTSSMMYTTRDIKKDEEILTDYNLYPTKYSRAGM